MILNRTVLRIPSLMVLLALLEVASFNTNPFKITETHLTAKEGSCITIECNVLSLKNTEGFTNWFWIKNAEWVPIKNAFNGTIIVSSNPKNQPPAPDLAHRVKYIGSKETLSCSLVINNLQKTDSGIYKFRYKGTKAWITDPGLNLIVEDEPCQVHVDPQPAVNESDQVTIKCSTLGICGSPPEITGLRQNSLTSQTKNINIKSTEVSFAASWLDDGRVLSCEPYGNKDKCMVRDIKLTVEYAPKETIANVSSLKIKEQDDVILTCSSRGHPNATYSWYRGSAKQNSLTTFKMNSIKPEDSGEYHCESVNKHGTDKSKAVTLNVTYAPKGVNVVPDNATQYKEGNRLKMICKVNISNPPVHIYNWFKDGKHLTGKESTYDLNALTPEDSGKYECEASNEVGLSKSPEYQINVQYVPRNAHISLRNGGKVKVGSSVSLTCDAQAYPAPSGYTWYYTGGGELEWKKLSCQKRNLRLDKVALENHGCYKCNVANDIGQGPTSGHSCIDVLYGPTEPVISMVRVAQEGQTVSFSCTVRSRPDSSLSLSRTPSASLLPGCPSAPTSLPVTWCSQSSPNVLSCTCNVTLCHQGVYACTANNSEGQSSAVQELEITYSPKDVRAVVHPEREQNENQLLSLTCTAHSNPPVTNFTWVKTTGETRGVWHIQNVTVKSMTPSHSGRYGCTARNALGTGESQQVEVNVKYAPKHTGITHNMTSVWQSEGSAPVALSCHSHGYPPVRQYNWFKLAEDQNVFVSKEQNITVRPGMPGTYYCIADNPMGSKESARIKLFLNRVLYRVLFQVSIFVALLLVVLLSILFYRYKKKSLTRPGTSYQLPCCAHFGFLAWRNGTSENLVEVPRDSSRDDLRPGVRSRPEPHSQPQDAQPSRASGPNSTSTSRDVYSVLKLPHVTQNNLPGYQRKNNGPTKHRQDETVNYALVQFKGHGMNRLGMPNKEKEGDIYSKVVKPKLKEKTGKQDDYENVAGASVPAPSRKLETDTETESSEDDVEINYPEVKFRVNPGQQNVCGSQHQKARHDSSSSSEEDYKVHYTDVKI